MAPTSGTWFSPASLRQDTSSSTAREASQRDYRVVFLGDGTATKEMNGVSAAELQRATLASLGMVFAHIATVDEVTTALRIGHRESAPV